MVKNREEIRDKIAELNAGKGMKVRDKLQDAVENLKERFRKDKVGMSLGTGATVGGIVLTGTSLAKGISPFAGDGLPANLPGAILPLVTSLYAANSLYNTARILRCRGESQVGWKPDGKPGQKRNARGTSVSHLYLR